MQLVTDTGASLLQDLADLVSSEEDKFGLAN